MTEETDRTIPDPDTVRKLILANRSAFGNYNIARLGELIRRLPENRRRCFETVPILLHMNVPSLPGYIDDPRVPHGIYRFSESGFWKIGKRHLGIEEDTVRSFLLKRYCVRGVYLVGSSGTQGQTDHSDLNYWLLIDRESAEEKQRELLRQKLERIKQWAWEIHGQALTFLFLDLHRIQRNDFSGWEDPCVALPQGSLTKEEFYRTFVLIAGQIPFWAVLPPGLTDEEYRRWIEGAGQSSDMRFMPEDYADLGNLTSVRTEESWGALLAEVCRFRRNPVKSMIRASLVAHGHLYQEQEGTLSESIKRGFLKPGSEGEPPDPSVYGFERAVSLYERIDDREGLDLVRHCVFLRLAGYPEPRPIDDEDPKRGLLIRLLRHWSWSTDQGDRIESYVHWTEPERLLLEDRILQRLWFLFSMVAKTREVTKKPREGSAAEDPDLLRKRLETRLSNQPGKIPYASAYLRSRRDPFSLHVVPQKDPFGADLWAAYDHPVRGGRIDERRLFADPQLTRVIGWIVLNGLYRPERTSVLFHHPHSPIVARRAEGFLKETHLFFRKEASAESLRSDPAWIRLLVVLDPGLGQAHGGLTTVVLLARNTSGDMFFLPLDMAHVENNLLRCYEIAKRVWQYRVESQAASFSHQIYHSRTAEDVQATKHIEEFIGSFRKDQAGDPLS